MRVTVQFMGQARLAAGCERTTLEINPDCSAPAAVRQAAAEGGDELRTLLFHPNGQPRRSVLLIVGTRQVSWDESEPLLEGECLTILPPIAGGAA